MVVLVDVARKMLRESALSGRITIVLIAKIVDKLVLSSHREAISSLVVTIEVKQAESRGWLESQVVSWAAGRSLVHSF